MTTETPGDGLRIERRGATAVWTIDRPAQRNALNRELIRAIGEAARAAHHDDSIRSIVLTGAGEKAFCAGADLAERRTMSLAEIRDMLALYRTELWHLDHLPKPTIAALNGVAFGGGLEIALCCDLRVMAPHAQLGLTEVSLGIIPGAGGTQRLTRLVGEAKAKEMLLLARRLGAPEALALGIVNRVAPDGRTALDTALEWSAVFETGAPVAMASALEAVDAACDLTLDAGLAAEVRAYERTLATADRIEALDAFLAKRPPAFTGK
jgi:methylglutaconyl-CoA hydratase